MGILLTFTLYSLPPFRLKGRGWLGGIADTLAVHVFPLLFCLYCAAQGNWNTIPSALFFWALTWACWGLRGFIWHQLDDRQYDLGAGLKTIPSDTDNTTILKWSRCVLFPLELAGLLLFLLFMGEPVLWGGLLVYILLEWIRHSCGGIHIILVRPASPFRLVMQECYEVWLPLAMAILLLIKHPDDLAIVALHLLLFGQRLFIILKESLRILFFKNDTKHNVSS